MPKFDLGRQVRESSQLGLRLPTTWSTTSPLRGTNRRAPLIRTGQTRLPARPGGNQAFVTRIEEGEAMYIGAGTIIAILVIVLLIAFVF
jgi:hypothetical protein